ncbi:hypothetical protein MACK_003843 [Theileria orientalis]|uniref:Uncharacterized protein n=1 Tax=Theileria orientalis TaxID=68886 RepID=A0A976SIY8_THEOR|nr:hypothetical protein MACK_003843 [Theileria orientalis]
MCVYIRKDIKIKIKWKEKEKTESSKLRRGQRSSNFIKKRKHTQTFK